MYIEVFIKHNLEGAEIRYQALEKAALAVVFSARRLRHYFQSFTVLVMTEAYPESFKEA